jgi:hypothetical protein
MAESKNDDRQNGAKPGEASTEFPLLKDDSAPNLADESAAAPSESATRAGAAAHPPQSDAADAAQQKAKPTLRDRLAEPGAQSILVPRRALTMQSRRDFLMYGTGVVAAAAGFWWLLPDDTRGRALPKPIGHAIAELDSRIGLTSGDKGRRDRFLKGVLTFDDDVAEALYSPSRLVPTYSRADITPNLRNNYDGQTPDPSFIPDWTLTVSGLASGRQEELTLANLLDRFARHEQITRLVCVEGWSAIAWWGGLRFADFLKAYSPAQGMRWANIQSSVNLDSDGNSDPYYVSIDLATARHPQALLATHRDGKPLDVEHGAPLRLVVPMKLGLKNIKAVTSIEYTRDEPADYWNDGRGYSRYDGL